MDENDTVKIWKPWVQHWRFANQTAFRIPEYLESVLGAWRQVSLLLQSSLSQPKPLQFVRHALVRDSKVSGDTPRYGGGKITAVAQFTQSTILARLLAATDGCEIAQWAVKLRGNIVELAKHLGGSNSRTNDWTHFVDQIEKDPGSALSEHEIGYDLLRGLPGKTAFEDEHLPVLASSLYLAFASAGHVGFLAHHLNKRHLSLSHDERDRSLAYLVEMGKSGGQLAEIKGIWPLDLDKTIHPVFDKDETQSPAIWVLGSDKKLELSDIIFELWKALNEDLKADDFHSWHLAVPVYTWSEAPREGAKIKTHRYRAGALLGWAFHQFNETEAAPTGWPSNAGAEPLDANLYQHIRSLSFMLEDFAANYLVGETEWALERKWDEGDTAESYMRRNFHHAGGWQCAPFLTKKDFDDYYNTDENSTGLKVSLTRRIPGCSEKGKATLSEASVPLVVHITPNSLCLAPDPTPTVVGLYHAFTAEKARQFYDRCVALAGQRSEGETQERETISHEIKHIVKALKGGKWWLVPDDPIRSQLAAIYNKNGIVLSASEARICPFPGIFKSTARILELWSGTRDPVLMFDEDNLPSDLKSTVIQIWNAVTDALLSLAVFNDSITTPKGSRALQLYQEALANCWDIEKHLLAHTLDGSVPLPGKRYSRHDKASEELDKDNWLVAIRVLLSKFTDIFKHSDPHDFTITLGESTRVFSITIEAAKRPEQVSEYTEHSLRALSEALSRRAFFRTGGEGQKIIRRLCEKSPAFFSIGEPSANAGRFKQTLTFNWAARR